MSIVASNNLKLFKIAKLFGLKSLKHCNSNSQIKIIVKYTLLLGYFVNISTKENSERFAKGIYNIPLHNLVALDFLRYFDYFEKESESIILDQEIVDAANELMELFGKDLNLLNIFSSAIIYKRKSLSNKRVIELISKQYKSELKDNKTKTLNYLDKVNKHLLTKYEYYRKGFENEDN